MEEEQINKLSSNSINITYILEVSVFNCADEDYSSPDHIIYITRERIIQFNVVNMEPEELPICI